MADSPDGPDQGNTSETAATALMTMDAPALTGDDRDPEDPAGLARVVEEAWEEELEEREQAGVEIKGWDELCEQIKTDLAKSSKTSPLSRINQLLLIRNFATL